MAQLTPLIQTHIKEIEDLGPDLRRFTLVAATGSSLPFSSVGDRISIYVKQDTSAHWCDFSLISNPWEKFWQILIKFNPKNSFSGGGTLFTSSKPGHYLVIKPPCTGISLRTGAHQIFIAGGSGASGLLQLAQDAAVRQKLKVEFHHAIRQSKGLRHLMSQALHDNYYCYESENNIRMNIKAILKRQPKDTHIYACGPLALLIDVIQSTHELNRPLNQVHWDKAFDTVLLKKIRGFIHRSPREKWGSITSTDRTSLQS